MRSNRKRKRLRRREKRQEGGKESRGRKDWEERKGKRFTQKRLVFMRYHRSR